MRTSKSRSLSRCSGASSEGKVIAGPPFDELPRFPGFEPVFLDLEERVYAAQNLTYPALETAFDWVGGTKVSSENGGISPTRKDSQLLEELDTDLEIAFSDEDEDEDDWDDDDWDDDEDDDAEDDDEDEVEDDEDSDRYSDDEESEWTDDTFDDDWTDETPEVPEGIAEEEDDDDEDEVEEDDWEKKED